MKMPKNSMFTCFSKTNDYIKTNNNNLKINKNVRNRSNGSKNICQRRSSSNRSSSDNSLKMIKNLGNRSNGSNNIRRRRNLSNGSSLYNHHQMNCSPLKLRQYDRSSTEYCRAKVIRTRMIIGQPKHVPKVREEEEEVYCSCYEDN
ncbi:unnamed protein product [Rotaria sordida]|uniref:Uncharacterized protein n=1 Tax=Rotaria sordida TaxID=392033 RepID=A0A815IMH2_9BILA|nr:unnamed protein product [Rotaria sordida]CAF1367816.1 unnamed protein product [Rotaria sordida]